MEKAYGASVRGKYHVENRLPNQDAFLIDNRKFYTLAVVCDGLGSKKHSRIASKRLCNTVKREVRAKFKKRNLAPINLIETIQKKFLKKIRPFTPKNCDATCLISLISSKSIMLFQVGDGLNVIKYNGSLIKCDVEEKDFTNETKSFGSSKQKDWHFKIMAKEVESTCKILMCTDGISEDIIEETMSDFIDVACEGVIGKRANDPFLEKILKEWPNKYSKDDKTVVVVK